MAQAGERRLRILALLTGDEAGAETNRLCRVSAEVTGMSGAGLMLLTGDVPSISLCTSDTVSARLAQLQFDLGEGPGIEASRLDRPVLEPDLADPETSRWPAFTGPALEAGARAVFGFPLQVGAVRLGALDLHRDSTGPLGVEQHADALAMADVAAQAVLFLQSEAPPGALAAELEVGADLHYVVHQAAGMVAAQLEITVGQALVRLRAHAFGNDRPLTEIARAVVERTLRFSPGIDE